ncbi:M56 family metallopeptidase [Flavobacterium notoginsengisoli]|uniref:M56 family metallopeptidase n=1 Tax=Flavobacterium notoginsengisoli TaxID=1478199 RepID=UPI003638F560
MIDFLIKSTISLYILLAAYHLFLEKERMFRFNRYFLLLSLLFSMAVPFISFEVQGEIPAVYKNVIPLETITNKELPIQVEMTNVKTDLQVDYWISVLEVAYLVITLLLSFRFIYNIYTIIHKAQVSKVILYQNTRMVLLSENNLPYTFWNTIYISQKDFENREIEQELFTHEIAHVKQKHTIDVIFIEVLKIIFWFNPVFSFYKKAIQLNHEFLADENVLSKHSNVIVYQNLLLNKTSAVQPNLLTSNLNFLATKKRLIMMTKITSKSKAVMIKSVLIIVFTGLIVTLCVDFFPSKLSKSQELQDKRRGYIYSGIRITINDQIENKKISAVYENLDSDTKRKYLGAYSTPFISKQIPSNSQFEKWKNNSQYTIWLNNKRISNSGLNNLKRNEIAYFSDQKVNLKFEKTSKESNTYYLYTQKFFEKYRLERFPQKYAKKEFKTTWIKGQPTEEQTRITREKFQKNLETTKVEMLNNSPKYIAQTFIKKANKDQKIIGSEIQKKKK